MKETAPTLESLFEELLRRIIKEEIQAANQNGHHERNLLFSATQAAKRWDIPVSKIREMARRGELPCVRLGHYVRFSPFDLARFVEEHKEKPPSK